MKRMMMGLMLLVATAMLWATDPTVTTFTKNTETTVTTCSGTVTLSTAVDYVITATSSALTGSINITNDKATVVFQNIKPSTVINTYLSKIKINGAAAKNGTNCRVEIYRHGAIVLPYGGNTYQALTVYDALNQGGTSKSDFTVNTAYRALGAWDNRIMSFTLKRGYMVTMANHIDGTGYSHCFIANDADITVNLPATMRGSVSFLRIFPWRWPSKKGYAGKDDTPMSLMNVTWFYQWNAESYNYANYEYVPQRHHETGTSSTGKTQKYAWPTWGTIDALNGYTHVLGQNEPDNTGSEDEVYMNVDELVKLHKYFLYSGMRIGTFATTTPNATWVKNYVNLCKEQNMRVDFVATHYYKGGQSPTSFINDLKALHTATGLPVWVTEWNNGASWTNETGFTLADGSTYTWGSGDDHAKNGQWLVDCLTLADENEWLERLAVYNSVGQKRFVHWETDAHWTTTAGGKYGAYQSKLAYDPSNEVFMSWVYSNPSGLSGGLTYDGKVRLSWSNPNTDCTKTVKVQRQNGSRWTDVATDGVSDSESRTIEFTDASHSGATYRICNVDADGTSRYSETYVFPTNAIPGLTEITSLPSDIENYYFRLNSAESSTDLCWGLTKSTKQNDDTKQTDYKAVQYAVPTVDGSDTGLAQTWQFIPNGSGYALANLSYETQVMASPNAWNFRTNGETSTTNAKAAYLPAYDSTNKYWTVQNLGYSNSYCGWWDNTTNSATRTIAAGAELAGNRNATGADHLTLYALKRQDVLQQRIDAKGLPTDLTFAISNHDFTWGTYSAGTQGSGANNIPNEWKFNYTFGGWNDSKLDDATIDGTKMHAINFWAGKFTYAEMSQTLTSLPNGVYHLSAYLATDNGVTPQNSITAIYGAPTNSDYTGRSVNLTGQGAENYSQYDVYVQVDDNRLTVGARSDGTWFKIAKLKLEYMGTTSQVSSTVKQEVEHGQKLQRIFLLSGRMKSALDGAASLVDAPMYKTTKATMQEWADKVNQDFDNEDADALAADIASLESAVTMARQSADVYATLKAELDASQTKKNNYSRTAGLSAYTTAYDAMQNDYLNGEFIDESIPVQIINVKEFTNLYLMSDLQADATVSAQNPADITDFILDRLPLTDNADAWMAEGTTKTNANANGVEFYNKNFTMLQKIYGLPTGMYKLTTQAFYRYGNQGTHYNNFSNNTLQPNAVLYITSADLQHSATAPIAYISDDPSGDTTTGGWTSDYSTAYGGSVPNDMAAAGYAFTTLGKYQPTESSNTVVGWQNFAAGEAMQVGARKETLMGADWTIFYTFHLYYLGHTVTLDETSADEPFAAGDVDVLLKRTVKVDTWNTICLPFDLDATKLKSTFGSDVVVKRLSSVVSDGDNTSLRFTVASEMQANVPYILKTSTGGTEYRISAVDLKPSALLDDVVDGVIFRGNYVSPTVLSNTDGEDYYVSGNQIKHSTGRVNMKGYRAYFHTPLGSLVKTMGYDPDYDDATGIEIVDNEGLKLGAGVYDLQGRRVKVNSQSSIPNAGLPKGIYIIDGKKVVVK